MQTKYMSHRTLFISALVALIAFIGGVVSNLVATDLEILVKPYRTVVWVIFGISLLTAVIVAIKETRQNHEQEDVTIAPLNKTASLSVGGNIKDSKIIVGNENTVKSKK